MALLLRHRERKAAKIVRVIVPVRARTRSAAGG
jgi:hypothetical protein